MKTIPLNQEKMALVDDSDYDFLNQFKWYARATGSSHIFYAVRNEAKTSVLMHRLILGLRPGDKRQADHRDGNGLNNCRSNLRICTGAQNRRSQRSRMGCTSRYKGVCRHCRDHKWKSQIRLNRKLIYLGLFNSEIAAAKAYDLAALKHHGEFAMTNEMLGLY